MIKKRLKTSKSFFISSGALLTSALISPLVLSAKIDWEQTNKFLQNQIVIDGFLQPSLSAKSGLDYQDDHRSLLKEIIQFSDNNFVNQPLLTTNLNFATWYANAFLDLTINRVDLYGTTIEINLVYRDLANQAKKAISAKIINLHPKLVWNIKPTFSVDLNPVAGLQTTSEFMENPVINLNKMIQFGDSNENLKTLVSTNLSQSDLAKLKPIYHFGQVDAKAGTIVNNEISFLTPVANQNQPQWDFSEDHFERLSYKFDLINFIPLQTSYVFNLDQEVKLDPDGLVAKTPIEQIDRNLFLNQMVNYQSNYLKAGQLVATTDNQSDFVDAIEALDFNVIDRGHLEISLKLAGQEQQKWILSGFIEPIVLMKPAAKFINNSDYYFLSQLEWTNAFTNQDEKALSQLVDWQLDNFFTLIYNYDRDDWIDAHRFISSQQVQVLPTLGTLRITFYVDYQQNVIIKDHQGKITNDQSLVLNVQFANPEPKVNVEQKLLVGQNYYDGLDDFVNNFIKFNQKSMDSNLDPNQSSYPTLLSTDLTNQEFLAISKIHIEKDPQNKIALITIEIDWPIRSSETIKLKVITNSQLINASFINVVDAKALTGWQDMGVDDLNPDLVLDLINFNHQAQNDYGLKIAISKNLFTNVLLESVQINKGWKSATVTISYYDAAANGQLVKQTFVIENLRVNMQIVAIISSLTVVIVVGIVVAWWLVIRFRQSAIRAKINCQQQYLRED